MYIYIYVSICDYIWYSRHFPAIHFEFGNFSLKRKATFGHRSSGLLVQASGLVSSSFSLRMVMVKTHLTSKWPKPRWNIRTQAMDPLLVSWFTVTVKRIFDQVLWLGLLGKSPTSEWIFLLTIASNISNQTPSSNHLALPCARNIASDFQSCMFSIARFDCWCVNPHAYLAKINLFAA